MQGPEFDFGDFQPNNLVMLEGLLTVRARIISERAARRENIDVPSMGTLRNDRRIKDLAFDCRHNIRDTSAECLMMLALRRGCMFTAQHSSNSDGRPILLRLHLLSTYSSLRDDSFSANRWIELVKATFGDMMPSRLIMLDHRNRNGQVHKDTVDPRRDYERLERDCNRRYEALRILQENFGVQILNLPAGNNVQSEVGRAIDFIHRSSK